MKKLVLGVLAIVFVLAGVVLARTLAFTSQQMTVDPAPAIEIDLDAAVERLSESVRFMTVSYQDPADFEAAEFLALHRFLESAFPKVHATLSRETVSEYSLLYTWTGSNSSLNPIVLCAHMDVVPVAPGTEDAWNRDAFSGLVEDGFVWGRGTLDDKVNMMAIFEAIEHAIAEGREPARTVYLAFGHDEEIGGNNGAVKMAELLKSRGVEAEFVLDEGGAVIAGVLPGMDAPMATVGIAEKGYVSAELIVEAEGGHSSQPPSETAIGILSRAVYRVETNQMPASIVGPAKLMLDRVGPEMAFGMKAVLANLWLFAPLVERQFSGAPTMNSFIRTTTAPTIFNAGVKENVLPAQARAVINFRILPGDTIDSVIQHVRDVVADVRVSVEPMGWARNPSKVSPHDSAAFATIERTIREIATDALATPYLVMAGTDARHYEIISENIYRFSPMALDSEDIARIHGTNERIGVENYGQMIHFFYRLLDNAALSGGGSE